MKQKARISGVVAWVQPNGQRWDIPTGVVDIELFDSAEKGCTLFFEDYTGQARAVELNSKDWTRHQAARDIVLL